MYSVIFSRYCINRNWCCNHLCWYVNEYLLKCHCWTHTYNHTLYAYLHAVIMCRSTQSGYQVSCEWTDSAGLKHRRPGAQDRGTHCLLLKVWSKSKSLIWHLQVCQWSTCVPVLSPGTIANQSSEQKCCLYCLSLTYFEYRLSMWCDF